MEIEAGSQSIGLIYRALGVVQRLVKKIGKGATLKRDELRAGELATQALRASIADPAHAHRQELLVQEAERLAPKELEPRREPRDHAHRPHPKGPRKRTHQRHKPGAAGKRKPATVTVKKKPKHTAPIERKDPS